MQGIDMGLAAAKISQSLSPAVSTSGATAASQPTTAGTSSSTGTSISSNDFLTLLVTEMKNQDPTQPTDPNAYIQQLVGVNSLQQLIAINQDLTSVSTDAAGTSANPVTGV